MDGHGSCACDSLSMHETVHLRCIDIVHNANTEERSEAWYHPAITSVYSAHSPTLTHRTSSFHHSISFPSLTFHHSDHLSMPMHDANAGKPKHAPEDRR
mmetsp:Transcript_8088/g.23255  ORF Transcript_8088/g.23255 Transcript_8088/m.23255 type:complete len:99 (+) Transcript_8088:244-540(+)